MSKINKPSKVIIHCADTPDNRDIDVKEIDRWHKARGFRMVGYHYVIKRNGVVEVGRNESMIGAHCLTQNAKSIGICLIGRHDFSSEQFKSLNSLLMDLKIRYRGISIHGHSEFSYKTCPNFDVKKYVKDNNI